MKQELFRIEQESLGDPQTMQAKFENFHKGFIGKIEDPEVAGLLNEQFVNETQPSMRRALQTKRDVLDSQVKTQAVIAATMAHQGLTDAIPGLFDSDPGAVDEASKKIQTQADKLAQLCVPCERLL